MQLYRPTQLLRTTLKQEAEIILEPVPDGDAPHGSYRSVQLLVPDGNTVYAGIDVPIQRAFDHGGVGPNRNYLIPQIPSGETVKFRLLPHQFLIGVSDSGLSYASLIVEYCQE